MESSIPAPAVLRGCVGWLGVFCMEITTQISLGAWPTSPAKTGVLLELQVGIPALPKRAHRGVLRNACRLSENKQHHIFMERK